MKRRTRALFRLSLPALALLSLVASGGLREDEIDCEEAVAHLDECCPGFAKATSMSCTFGTGCEQSLPELTVDESRCVTAASCDEIRSRNLCETLKHVMSPDDAPADGVGGLPVRPRVCP
jgi:hypothetical protein